MNRFYRLISPSQYQPKDIDTIFKTGLLKDQNYQANVDNIQGLLNKVGSIETITPGDHQYIQDKQTNLLNNINELAKEGFDNPITINKINSEINSFIQDPNVDTVMKHTKYVKDAYAAFQKQAEDGKQSDTYLNMFNSEFQGLYKDPESFKKLDFTRPYTVLPYSGYKEAGDKFLDNLKANGIISFDKDHGVIVTEEGIDFDRYAGVMTGSLNPQHIKELYYKFGQDIQSDPTFTERLVQAYEPSGTLNPTEIITDPNDPGYEDFLQKAFSYYTLNEFSTLSNALAWENLGTKNLPGYGDDKKPPKPIEIPGAPFKQEGSDTVFQTNEDGDITSNKDSDADAYLNAAKIPNTPGGARAFLWTKGLLKGLFDSNVELKMGSDGWEEMYKLALEAGYADGTEEPYTASQKIKDFMNNRTSSSIQGSLVAPDVDSDYKENFNDTFYNSKDKNKPVVTGAATNFAWTNENGEKITGKEFVQDNNGKYIDYIGTYLDPFSPFEYGSTEANVVNEHGVVRKYIMAPTLSAMRTENYFINGVLRASQAIQYNEDGHFYNKFNMISGSEYNNLDGSTDLFDVGEYTSEQIPGNAYKVTNPDGTQNIYKLVNGQLTRIPE